MIGREDLVWVGSELHLNGRRGRILARVKPDPDWPGMWRAHLPNGHISDMVNLSRAKDCAAALCSRQINNGRKATCGE